MRIQHAAVAGLLILGTRCRGESSPTGPNVSTTPAAAASPTQSATATRTPLVCPALSGWYDRRFNYDCILFPARPETFLVQSGCTINFNFMGVSVTGDVQGQTINFRWRNSEQCPELTGFGTFQPSLEMPGRFVISGVVTAPTVVENCCTRISFTLTPRRPG